MTANNVYTAEELDEKAKHEESMAKKLDKMNFYKKTYKNDRGRWLEINYRGTIYVYFL